MRTVTLIIAALVAATLWAAPEWQPGVERLIEQGEFAQASRLMKRLPKATRRTDAVVIDSLETIMARIRADFNMTPEQGAALIRERLPQVTAEQIDAWKAARKLEVMNIDGTEWWFRKSVRNLWLLADEFDAEHRADRAESVKHLRRMYLEAMRTAPDSNGVRDRRKFTVRFTLDVNADAVPAGEVIRAWMPLPYANLRQSDIRYLGGNREATMSSGSKHHTVYMEAVAAKGQPTRFEYEFSYVVGERHLAQQDLLLMLEPYDTDSELYRTYTAQQLPHVIINDDTRALARDIVGDETNPVLQAKLLFEWISEKLPWAGAREYSTIACMPAYVLLNHHGDCGQVALLYISLCRSLGIPARWESGWVVEPGDEGWHDWTETYFEGIGWVPTDPSYGRSTVGTPLNDYYAAGIDLYRMASNEAVGDRLDPPKTYIRSETVDFQPGEVEWRGGNLYYDKWHSSLKVVDVKSVK